MFHKEILNDKQIELSYFEDVDYSEEVDYLITAPPSDEEIKDRLVSISTTIEL